MYAVAWVNKIKKLRQNDKNLADLETYNAYINSLKNNS